MVCSKDVWELTGEDAGKGIALQKGIACEELGPCRLVAAGWSWASGLVQAVLHFQGVNLWSPTLDCPSTS